MLRGLLSDDLPRSRWLTLALLLVVVGLAVAPFAFRLRRGLAPT